MIRPINIKLNAAHPELPLVEATTFTGAPSSVFIRGVPKSVGNWSITAVNVAVTYPDNSTTTRAAVESAEGVWVATIPGTATSGRTTAGFRILADGIDENGAAVTGYVLGFADFSVFSFLPVPAPGETYYLLRYFDTMPTAAKKMDVTTIDGILKYYNGTTWLPFAAYDDAVTPTSANGVKSSGIWSAIWGALSALPTGFTSLYDWCVAQLAKYLPLTGGTMTGGLTVPNLTVGSGSAIGANSVAEGGGTTASGNNSHAEGSVTTASGNYSHAEGWNTTASGRDSHVEGWNTTASGQDSHAEGGGTIAQNKAEHAQGRFNDSHKASDTIGDAGNTLSSIGFGTADNARKNAVEVMQDGKTFIYGLGEYNGTNPTNATDLATLVNGKQSALSDAQLANIAAVSGALAFDATHSYAAGDPVVYNGTLYTFNAAHTGAWTGSDVAAVDIIEMLAGKLGNTGNQTLDGSLTLFGIALTNGTIIYNGSSYSLSPWMGGTLALMTHIAPDFSAQSSYEVGQLVVQNFILKRCTTAGTGSAAVFAIATVEDVLAALRTGKADKCVPQAAGNLAALDANGNPTDSQIPAANVATKGNIPYDLVTKTISNGAVSLDDRASNSVTVSATLSPNTLTINFPTATSGKVRDFAMRLNIAAGATAPEIAWPQGVTLENNGGEVPEIADGGTGGSSTILYFSETENDGTTAKFLVKGETLTAITQA